MNISKLASTVIMATSIATLFLFAMIFYLYGADQNALEKAFSITSGFFGGIAALVAAYIATQLFNDWKLQVQFELNKEIIMNLWDSYIDLKVLLVPLSDQIKIIGYNNLQQRNEIFDQISAQLTCFYYKQQRLELLFEINQDNYLFVELEKIIKNYVDILDPNRNIHQNSWEKTEAELIKQLNTLQPELYRYLKSLNKL